MTQFEKLQSIIRNPKNYGVKRNARVFKMLCDIYMYGVACTGFSNRSTKYIETYNVYNVLRTAGISCKYYNSAPRGGASGEHVELVGTVQRECKNSYRKFILDKRESAGGAFVFSSELERAYLSQLL